MSPALHALLVFGVPLAVVLLARRLRLPSPVIVCYVVGLVLGNLGLIHPALALPLERDPVLLLAGVAVLLAIPLLLFSADLVGALRLARRTLASSALCCASVALVALATAPLFAPAVGPEAWKVAGMLAGTYTGSMPNLIAVGRALGVDPLLQTQVVAADLVAAGGYGLFLLSPGVRAFGRLLPPFPAADPAPDAELPQDDAPRIPASDWTASLGLALGVAALGAGVTAVVPGRVGEVLAILAVTTLAVGLSLVPRVRRLRASPLAGDYFLVVFCLAFGCLADLQQLWTSGLPLCAWTCSVLLGGVVGHALLCRVAGIDRDTCVITHTAAIYSPAFVPPVAQNLGNRELVLAGISAALIGIAAGNYLGLAVAYAARWLLGT